jgi:CRP/FNR family transcriptional regulator
MDIDIESELKKNDLFSCLDRFQISRLSRAVIVKRYKRGALIFSEGEPASGFYIIAEGKVKIYKLSAQGKEYIMHIGGSGDSVAGVAVFSNQNYPAYAQAMSNSALLFFPKTAFLEALKEEPEIGMRMLGALASRQRRFVDTIEDLSLRDVLGRLSRYLLNLTQEKGKLTFELDIQKSDLALKLATVPETLSRNLKKLKAKRIISLNGKTITILDKEALRRLSAG